MQQAECMWVQVSTVLEPDLPAHKSDIQRVEQRMECLEQRLEQLTLALSPQRSDIQKLEQRMENFTNELSHRKADYEQHLKELRVELSSCNANIRRLELRISDMTDLLNYSANEDPQDALRQLLVAERLGFQALVNKMASLVMGTIDISNCIHVFQLAGKLELEELWDKAFHFTLENFQEVYTKNADFCGLTLAELCTLLLSDDLIVDNENLVFKAIVKWIESNSETRKGNLPVLVGLVRLPCLDPSSLLWMRDHHLIYELESVRKAIDKLEDASREDLAEEHQRGKAARQKRMEQEEKEWLFVFGGSPDSTGKVELLEEVGKEWKVQTDIGNYPRGHTWSALIGKEILVIEENGKIVPSLDPLTRKWKVRAPLPGPRPGSFSVASLHNKVYVMGGMRQRRCDVYNPKENTWTEISYLNIFRNYSGAVAFKGRVYCAGGVNSQGQDVASVDVFDPNQNRWTPSIPMRRPRHGHSLVACQNYIWTFGGQNKDCLSTVERFDPIKGTEWESMPPMPTPRCYMAAAFFGGRFYVIGGYKSGETTNITEIYDPIRASWERGPDINEARYFLAATVIRVPKAS